MKSNLILLLLFIIISSKSISQTITISEARTKTIGTTVSIKGIITNGSELGAIRYIQDNTAGIGLYDSKLSGLKRGDEVFITGKISEYNNLLEVSNVTAHNILSNENPLPDPIELSFSDGFTEKYEGQLVKFKEVTFVVAGTFNGKTNYDIKNGSTTKELRIESGTNIVGSQIPTKAVSVVGIMGQYKTNYQLLPRDLADLNFLNSVINPIDIQKTSLELSFTTDKAGSSIMKYGLSTNLELGEVKNSDIVKNHQLKIEGLTPATFYYVQALSVNGNDTVKSGLSYFSTASESSGEIKVYFNSSVDHSYAKNIKSIRLNKTLDDTMVAYINRASKSIDLAIYNMNNADLSSNISTALNNAANRGVTVRVIGDGDAANIGFNQFNTNIKVLKSPASSSNYKLMHNKFMTIDASVANPDLPIVWTGSMNLNSGQIHDDPNNVIIIQDQALAKAYTREFNEMWGSSGASPIGMKSKFGKFKTDNTPHYFNIGGKMVECYFSPSDNVNQQIINAIKTADASIYFATMVFTRTSIAYPMLDKHDDGVYVAGIFDNISGNNSAAYDVLQPAIGNDIKLYSGNGIFHHKYAIIDHANASYDIDPLVITGSHNWSSSANTSNDENTLIIHDKEIAAIYFQEWAQRFKDEGGTVFVDIDEVKQASSNHKVFIINNQLNIHFNAFNEENLTIQLYSLSGKLILNEEMESFQGFNTNILTLPKLQESIYIYRIVGETLNESGKLLRQ